MPLSRSGRDSAAAPERSVAYLVLWPGLDARSFLESTRPVERPRPAEWLAAIAKLALGGVLIAAATGLVERWPVVAACVGMTGIAFTLHFGVFHLLSVIWRARGFDAPPIMNAPILASSLGDFWGRRWNLAFRDAAHTFVFRPLVGKVGAAGAMAAVFLTSGVIHDAVISVSAGGGYGLPTLYFLIQCAGVFFERSPLGQRLGARRGLAGRLFCAAVVLGPVGLLFHGPFVERVVVPMFGGGA